MQPGFSDNPSGGWDWRQRPQPQTGSGTVSERGVTGHQPEESTQSLWLTPPKAQHPGSQGKESSTGPGAGHAVLMCGLGLDPGVLRATAFLSTNKGLEMTKFQMTFNSEI